MECFLFREHLSFVNVHIKLIFYGKTLCVTDVFLSWQVIYFALTRRDDLESVQTESRSTTFKLDIKPKVIVKIQNIANFKKQLMCLYTTSVILKNFDNIFSYRLLNLGVIRNWSIFGTGKTTVAFIIRAIGSQKIRRTYVDMIFFLWINLTVFCIHT
jgi:hypothetical protein